MRRIKAWALSATRRGERGETISRLQATREKLRRQWSARAADTTVSKHYEGAEKYEGEVLSDATRRAVKTPEEREVKAPDKETSAPEVSHIDRLLKAKRKKTHGDEDQGQRSKT